MQILHPYLLYSGGVKQDKLTINLRFPRIWGWYSLAVLLITTISSLIAAYVPQGV